MKHLFWINMFFTLILFSELKANELKIYIIIPRLTIDWTSPQNLLLTSSLNSMGSDYAPIGHFEVDISCNESNKYGISHVLTGMTRKNIDESKKIVLKSGMGLGSLTYAFQGKLQSAMEVNSEIHKATQERRLKILRIPTSKIRCRQMLTYLDNWIESGSYQVYGGGKNTQVGEGAGCADFAMQFYKIATQQLLINEWSAHVKIPKTLIGTKDYKVSMTKLLFTKKWASANEPHVFFETPDTNYTWNWLVQNGYQCGNSYLWTKHIDRLDKYNNNCDQLVKLISEKVESQASKKLLKFKFKYKTTLSPADLWEQIYVN